MSKTTGHLIPPLAAIAFFIAPPNYAVKASSPVADTPKVEAVAGSGLPGYWEGTLNAGALELRIQVHVGKGADGKLQGTFVSPDQSPQPLALTACDETADGATFAISVGSFEGLFNTDGSRLTGLWKQSGLSLPLQLKRQTKPPKPPARPQTPQPPHPYEAREVVIENTAAGITLAGTLTLPYADSRRVPAVILVCGSGPHDRDETLFGHKPFLVLADHLTQQGIAVFRHDKRGAGKSSGKYASATPVDFASDAAAVFNHLKTLPLIDPKRIGICGHSEGATEAFMVAAENPDVAFVISLAGTGVRMDKLLERQRADILKAMKQQPQDDRVETLTRQAVALARDQGNTPETRAEAGEKLAQMGLGEDAAKAHLAQLFSPWMISMLRYEPRPTLEKVKCPVLALNGGKDTQVAADINLPALRAGLEAGGNTDITTMTLPGLNHLFQKCETGAPDEYGKIEETLNPDALKTISGWITARFMKPR